jgi:prepilin-type N-terminal cleavage/methylation domain-containing protein
MARHNDEGFSLLEVLAAVSISLILAGIGFISLQPMLKESHMNSAYATTLMALRNTRNLAITQSHEYYVNFNPAGFPAGTIQIQYQPAAVGGGAAPPLQQVSTYALPANVNFAVKTGFPAGNTPDGFGAGVTAIDLGQGLTGAPLKYVVFMPDGSAKDSVGNLNNGVIYLSSTEPGIWGSRAITVWGATGRVRGWKLNQVTGVATWVQQ